jgi:hypothetical protein
LQSDFSQLYLGLNRTVELKTVLGRTYRFRFRVMNVLGWSDYSEITSVLAAASPSKPCNEPGLLSVDATQITLELAECASNNGALITDFILFMQTDIFNQPLEQGVYPISSTQI